MNLEFNYQEDKSRIAEQKKLSTELEWLKKIPVKEMVDLGWIECNKDKLRQLEVVLNFLGIASPLQFEKVWRNCEVAFRQAGDFTGDNEAVFSWLRKGEIEAQLIACQAYNARIFIEVLEKLKNIARNDYKAILPELVEMCASAVVAVVCLRSLPQMCVYGAARWVGGKLLIQLTEDYDTSEHFLFTFFHEACHILRHGKKNLFLEGLNLKSDKEKEADVFASGSMSLLG